MKKKDIIFQLTIFQEGDSVCSEFTTDKEGVSDLQYSKIAKHILYQERLFNTLVRMMADILYLQQLSKAKKAIADKIESFFPGIKL